ncbi:MAG: AAA family ATPase [Terracidiphilus sp.]
MLTSTLQETDRLGASLLSVALIGPHEQRRKALAGALDGPLCNARREFSFYPDLDQLTGLLERNFDVVLVDMDSNPEAALDLVETICASNPATVMVYSAAPDSELMIRCMRAGAREFLTEPFVPAKLAEALVRASARRSSTRVAKKADGKLLVFWGAKGGAGVTTLASNFAVWLARESGKSTLLIDLDLPLGDVALGLGVASNYSTADALANFHRLDANFLSRLLTRHSSGLSVLTAPGKVVKGENSIEAIDKLMWVARQEFEYVVVDSGSRLDFADTALFDLDAIFYLVTVVGISELRNANRLITECLATGTRKLEIVLNRYAHSSLGVDDEHITKALTRQARWMVPEDRAAERRMQSTASTLAGTDSPISTTLRQMARIACGLAALPNKRKRIAGIF